MSIKFSDIFGSNTSINNQKLEEVFNKTRDVAETVGKKSAERLEISRKKIEQLDVKTKLNKLYETFGEIQYRAYIGEKVDQLVIDETANQIAELKEKLDALNIEIDTAKEMFADSMASMAQKTREAFQRDEKTDEEVEVEIFNAFESEDDE